jgi:hypothetical protein
MNRQILVIAYLSCIALVFLSYPVFGQDLITLHPGCDTTTKSRDPDCVAAVHRFCSAAGRGGAGFVQEVGNGVLGVACFAPSWSGDVPLAQLTTLHSGCNDLGKSQSPDCMAAVHRWCAERGGAGLVQEIGNGVFGIACVQVTSFQDIAINDLRVLHSGCVAPTNRRLRIVWPQSIVGATTIIKVRLA